ncbi:MAG: hypothetical protein NZ742_04845, partial [Acidobacteria bacterium]|nr:hypothetical protein [Acidobacteriota bacterium]MDW7983594.1 hypothetical protein [Acidobacteriota bacterium]
LKELMNQCGGCASPENLARLNVSLPIEGPVLRCFDLDELFGTDLDLSGGYTDVSAFVRGADRDVDAYLLWRRIPQDGREVDEQVAIHPDELCPVPFYEARAAFRDKKVWILTPATGRQQGSAWRQARGGEIQPGDTVMVDWTYGCYNEATGWDPEARDRRPDFIVDRVEEDGRQVRAWVRMTDTGMGSVQEIIDDRLVGPQALAEDPRSFSRGWMELKPHLEAAAQEAESLAQALRLPDRPRQSLVLAARWHDVGKALQREENGQWRQPFQGDAPEIRKTRSGPPQGRRPVCKEQRPGWTSGRLPPRTGLSFGLSGMRSGRRPGGVPYPGPPWQSPAHAGALGRDRPDGPLRRPDRRPHSP